MKPNARSGLQMQLLEERLPFRSGQPFAPPTAALPWRPPATYADYLKSDRWGELAAEALRRDGYRCRFCDFAKNLQVHHRRYPEILGTETVEDLTTMCRGCHAVLEWFRGRTADRRARMAPLRRR